MTSLGPPKFCEFDSTETSLSDQFSRKYEISINFLSFHTAEKMFLVIHRPGKGIKHSPRSSVTIWTTIPCLQNLVYEKTADAVIFSARALPLATIAAASTPAASHWLLLLQDYLYLLF